MTQTLPKRSEVKLEETWDLSLLFKNQDEFDEAVNKLKTDAENFNTTYAGKLSSVETLLASLENYEKLNVLVGHISGYASLGYETDKTNEIYETNVMNLYPLLEYVGQKLAFYQPEICQLPENLVEEAVQTKYGYYLSEVLRSKQALLSGEVEEVLSALSSSLSNQYALYSTTKFQDLTFDDFNVNGKQYPNSFVEFEGDYECHLDANIRQASWKSFHDGLARYQHTLAANYISHVQTEKKIATLRGFDSVIDYLLFGQKVEREAYNRQIDVIMAEFAPVMRRYAKLLAKEQNLANISLADIKMPFSKEQSEKISIAESRQMVEQAFKVFGDEYLSVINRSFDERWIDFPMNQTKSTGGFCATYYKKPSYTLLNWTGLLSEVLVLAHELGHAGHFQLTYANQLSISPEASLYFIEAPSTANEVIMCQYLLSQPINNKQKRVLIAEFISRTYFHNMVTHLLEAHFQRKVYEAVDRSEVLNTKRLNDFFEKTLEEFWGDALEINEGAELTWMRQPHYFMGLYPYTYSAGLTIGTQIGQRIAKADHEAVGKWLNVLKVGGTKGPLELAESADVSMRDAGALRSTIAYVDGLLDQIESLKA